MTRCELPALRGKSDTTEPAGQSMFLRKAGQRTGEAGVDCPDQRGKSTGCYPEMLPVVQPDSNLSKDTRAQETRNTGQIQEDSNGEGRRGATV